MTALHAIGDTAWVLVVGSLQKSRPCRVCAGHRSVTLILGSGEHVALDCDFCGRGFEGPRGVETYYEFAAEPRPYLVAGVERYTDGQGEQVRYRSGSADAWGSLDAVDVFATPEAAAASGAEKVAAHEAEQVANLDRKEEVSRSYAWNAGYHLREAKRARAEAERHEKKAVIMQTRSKSPEGAL